MKHEVRVPRINANEDEVLLTQVLVAVGDYVSRNTEVATVESSKSSYSVDIEVDGWVSAIHALEGEMVDVGSVLVSLSSDKPGASSDDIPSAKVVEAAVSAPYKTAKERLKDKTHRLAAKNNTLPESTFEPQPSDKLEWVQAARVKLDELAPIPRTFTANELRMQFPGVDVSAEVLVKARRILIGTGVRIGTGTLIDADEVFLGDGVVIGKNTEIVTGELILGDGATVGDAVVVDLAGGRTIESRLLAGPATLVGGGAHINTSREVVLESESALSPAAMIFTHSFWQSALDGYPCRFERVRLAQRAWVGAGCQVLPGVVVGHGAVAVSNSTLVENVPPHVMVAGIPATVIRSNLGLQTNHARQRAVLIARLNEFWQWLRDRGCSVVQNESGAVITLPDATARSIVVISPGEDDVVLPRDSVVLSFGPRPLQAFAVFDLANYVVVGSEDRLVHSLRNFLRRLGVRLAPYSWRPDYRKEV